MSPTQPQPPITPSSPKASSYAAGRPTSPTSFYETVMDKALEKVIPTIMNVVDVDGVVRRIDIDDVVNRVDINTLLGRVDWNTLLQQVDWNKQAERIDFDMIVNRMDIDAIAAQSTTGIFTQMMDAVRTYLVVADLIFLSIARYRCSESRSILPPAPGGRQRKDRVRYPPGRSNKAIAVQGRYCGIASKAVAILIDCGIITITYSLMFIVLDHLWSFVLNSKVLRWFGPWLGPSLGLWFWDDNSNNGENTATSITIDRDGLWAVLFYCFYSFFYFFLGVLIANQTIGMAVVGIKVVNSRNSSHELSFCQVLLRTIFLPISLNLCPLLGLIGFVRRDGRMIHDLVAKTGMIHLWNARMAKLRAKKMDQIEGYDPSFLVSMPTKEESFHTAASERTDITMKDYHSYQEASYV